ncbi:putative GTPase activating protein [Diplonema papillatum]|nr:putative GTPase activating protein [Diplonema papillatum]
MAPKAPEPQLPVTTDFAELTKLNAAHAKTLLELANSDITAACAAFVQNVDKLPLDAWDETNKSDNWEPAARERKEKVAVSKLNSICHEAYSLVHEMVAAGKRLDVKLSEPDCWKHLAEAQWSLEAARKAAGLSKHNTKPLLQEPDFLERELTKAALLNENRGFLENAGEKPFELTADWISLLGPDANLAPAKLVDIKERDGDLERVIILDCVRTFACVDHQTRLEVFLNGAFQEFGNYSQGMAHVAALLLLTLPENDVIALLRKFNAEIPGHWKHESDGFGANAYVFKHIAAKHVPDVMKHFDDNGLTFPEMYTRKWFCGLGLHCLDVENVYTFLRAFLVRGFEYLISFGIAVLSHFKERLLETEADEIGPVMKLLALDEGAGVTADDQVAILELAAKGDYTSDLGTPKELEELRKEMYDKNLKQRMEQAKAAAAAAKDDDEICEECDLGNVARWVDEDDDGTLLCDMCKFDREAKGHDITEL